MQTSYVLITPARNEEGYIEHTLGSVISQTILPKKWVIVSDASTDHTVMIVSGFMEKNSFIQLVRRKTMSDRNFSSKVNAINLGYEQLANLEYDFIGILDADVSFGPNYYELVLRKFHQNLKLGIAGGIVLDQCGNKYNHRVANSWSVAGAIQLFRRQCFEDVGGLIPRAIGGEDTFAEVTARLQGWEVRSYDDLKVFHHRRTGTGGKNIYLRRLHQGKIAYLLGYHPFYVLLKCLLRIKEKPLVIGSLLHAGGYGWSWISRKNRSVSDDFVHYIREEQMQRLKMVFLNQAR